MRCCIYSDDQNMSLGADKMARQAKTLAAKYGDLNSVPRIHVIEGKNQRLKADLRPSHKCCGTCSFIQ